MVNTVLGTIETSKLGKTLIHEHLYVAPDELHRNYAYTLDVLQKSVEEARLFGLAGGETIVELTPLGYGRNTEALREISRRSGVNIICVTGFHKDLWLPRWFDQLTDNEIEAELRREIVDGIGYSGVHPGAAKLGTSFGEVTSREHRAFSIVAPLAREYHLPIITHCDKGTMGHEQLDLLEKYSFDAEHVCLSHTDLTMDFGYIRSLCERGAYLSFDHVGRDLEGHDHERVEMIANLVEAGCGDKICLAGDMGKKDYFVSYGGRPGLAYILTALRSYLLEGISEAEYTKMIVDNPRHVLAWDE